MRMPRSKQTSSNFSFGLWTRSSSRPKPTKQRVEAEEALHRAGDRDRAAAADQHGLAAEDGGGGAAGGAEIGRVGGHADGGRLAELLQLVA